MNYSVPNSLTFEVKVPTGSTNVKLSALQVIKDRKILGVVVKTAEDGINVVGLETGLPLLTRGQIAHGRIDFRNKNTPIHQPFLSWLSKSQDDITPGTYAKLEMPKGFDYEDSFVKFPPGVITVDSVLQITFITDQVVC